MPYDAKREPKEKNTVKTDAHGLDALLEKVFKEKGWDFRGYKKPGLARRALKRLHAVKAASYGEYCSVLDKDPAEYARLFSNITIKVSEFFREPEVFEYLCASVKEFYPRDQGMKVWCCGCAYGEEAYSLAILLSECFSPEGLKHSKVLATDIDPEALEQARKARYRDESIKNVPPYIREKYLFMVDGLYKVKYNVRNSVRFGSLDIVQSPTISRVDLLSCRNLFIYFGKRLQEKVFEKLDFALKPGGLLVMGKAEVLPHSYLARYEPMGERLNIYRKDK